MAEFDANAVGAANVEAVSVFKTPPAVLSESLFFLCAEQREVIESWILINENKCARNEKGANPHRAPTLRALAAQLPGWVPVRILSRAMGPMMDQFVSAERSFGPYLWAPEFDNFHDFWKGFQEPGFRYRGRHWRGPEQLFQASKAGDPNAGPDACQGSAPFEQVADEFAELSDNRAYMRGQRIQVRDDWDEVKDGAMKRALGCKFEHEDLCSLLVSTAPHPLCAVGEYSPRNLGVRVWTYVQGPCSPPDVYWGTGNNGEGRNRLAQLLMELRTSATTKHSSPMCEALLIDLRRTYELNPEVRRWFADPEPAGPAKETLIPPQAPQAPASGLRHRKPQA